MPGRKGSVAIRAFFSSGFCNKWFACTRLTYTSNNRPSYTVKKLYSGGGFLRSKLPSLLNNRLKTGIKIAAAAAFSAFIGLNTLSASAGGNGNGHKAVKNSNGTQSVNDTCAVPTITAGSNGTTVCSGISTTLTASAPLVPGAGNMLNFASSVNAGNVVALPAALATSMSGGFTFEAYINVASPITGFAPIFTFGSVDGTNGVDGSYMMLRVEGSGNLSFNAYNRNSNLRYDHNNFAANNTIVPGTTYHLALTGDGNNVYLYLNGNPTSYSFPLPLAPSTLAGFTSPWNYLGASLYSAQFTNGQYSFVGSMDEVRIWNSARTAAQIHDNYQVSVPAASPGLLAYYQFDEPTTYTGPNVTSSTGSNNGTLCSTYLTNTPQPWVTSTVTGVSVVNYSWSSPGNPNFSTFPSVTVSPTVTTNYTVTVTNGAGCTNSATQTVTVSPGAIPTITPPSFFGCVPQTVLTASGPGPYLWSTGETTQAITVSTNGFYTVSNGTCLSLPAKVSLRSSDITPAVITPDSNGTTICAGQSVTLKAAAADSGGLAGNMLYFASSAGASNYVRLPYNINSLMNGGVTWEGFIKPTSLASIQPVFTFGSSANGFGIDGSFMYLSIEPDGSMSWSSYKRNGNVTINIPRFCPAGTISAGTMYHLAVTLDGQYLRVYLNGVNIKTVLCSITPGQLGSDNGNAGANNFNTLGHPLQNDAASLVAFKGYMDEIRLWNIVRTDADIAANYNRGVDDSSPGLVASYHFDEDTTYTGPVIHSSTGSNADAVLSANYLTYTHFPWVRSAVTGYKNVRYVWSSPTNPNEATGGTATLSPAVTTTYTVTATAGSGCSSTATQTVTVFPAVVVTTQPANTTSCAGGRVGFGIRVTGATAHSWQQSTDGGATWTTLTNTAPFQGTDTDSLVITSTTTSMNNYKFRDQMTAGCGLKKVSASAALSTDTFGTPRVVINSVQGDSVCAGTAVIFLANVTLGGTAPTYVWRVNGSVIPVTGSAYLSDSVRTGTRVSVTITTNAPCATTNTATANFGPMFVSPASGFAPTVRIASSITNPCPGTPVTFTATAGGGGPNPVYTWRLNGVQVGTNSPVYSNPGLNPNDSVQVSMVSSLTCANPTNAVSKAVYTCVFQEYLWENFRDVHRVRYSDYTGSLNTASNPGPNPVDSSLVVGWYHRSNQAADVIIMAWDSALVDLGSYQAGNKYFSSKVFSPAPGTVITLALLDSSVATPSNYPAGRYLMAGATTTATNQWEQLYFKPTGIPDPSVQASKVKQLAVSVNPGVAQTLDIYFDNIYGPRFKSGATGITASVPEVSGFTLYPNPAGNTVSVRFNKALTGPALLEITDMSGRTVWQQSVTDTREIKINTDALTDGMYLCRTSGSQGTAFRKFVIQH